MTAEAPPMPEMAAPQYGFRHTVHSALETLQQLGISPRRVTIRMAGMGWPSGWIVEQKPAAGTPLTQDVAVELAVAGLGLFHHLPVAMWERGGESGLGTQEILELFDDSFQKAAHWIWEGARVYGLRPDESAACARWIALFGLEPRDWPEESWYELGLLLPALQRLAGREEGIRMALRQLLGLEVWEIRRRRSLLSISTRQRCALGASNGQLGLDTVIGNRVEGRRRLEVRLGPLTIETYDTLQQPGMQRRLGAVLDLTMPLYQSWSLSYEVLDRRRRPRLGSAAENGRLGINSYLGQGA